MAISSSGSPIGARTFFTEGGIPRHRVLTGTEVGGSAECRYCMDDRAPFREYAHFALVRQAITRQPASLCNFADAIGTMRYGAIFASCCVRYGRFGFL